jgi:dUTP pyrophosphatase
MNNNELQEFINRLKLINENLEKDVSYDKEIENVMKDLNTNVLNNFNNNLVVNIKKLHPNAVTPKYAKDGDAGLDLTATSIISEDDDKIVYGVGLAMEIPKHYAGLILPRSSIRNTDLLLKNPPGLIDSGYRGEIMLVFYKTKGDKSIMYKIGERIGQILILPYPTIEFKEVDSLSETERGEGGYGSTGK